MLWSSVKIWQKFEQIMAFLMIHGLKTDTESMTNQAQVHEMTEQVEKIISLESLLVSLNLMSQWCHLAHLLLAVRCVRRLFGHGRTVFGQKSKCSNNSSVVVWKK